MALNNDLEGSASYGVPTVTIGDDSFVAEDFEFSTSSSVYEQMDANGAIAGAVVADGSTTGSCTLQMRDGTLPTIGTEFSFNSLTWIITEVGQQYANDSEIKLSVSFRKKENS